MKLTCECCNNRLTNDYFCNLHKRGNFYEINILNYITTIYHYSKNKNIMANIIFSKVRLEENIYGVL